MICNVDKNTYCKHNFKTYAICDNYLPDCNCDAVNVYEEDEHVCILDGRQCLKPRTCSNREALERDIVCDNQVDVKEKSTMYLNDEVTFLIDKNVITKRVGTRVKILHSANSEHLLVLRDRDKFVCIDAKPYLRKLS